ncbi:DUF982 domain-containing protein [Aminobacter sp. MDW-2]|uniref:DUF982 domain-containing protein n=1 Tax=Aminobacter sp. MDW-2 TaxID=2666139 RepID=UPI0012B0F9D5|nr:DUF982 domain-containing protein [Aminobacter sp. MDW-2]MRX32780.1 DUF982 domain-containing protein [Aminobacter sp. MDW-2]QNH34558.1 DUF982 domain-containing protein [Aminobacter sp. MDW-2]
MMWFWPPVPVRLIANSGITYEVKAVEICLEQMHTWPVPDTGKRGPKWKKAEKAVYAALEGMGEPKAARDAFEAAAAEAGVLRSR